MPRSIMKKGKLVQYYSFVKNQRCVACGAYPPSEAAHVRVLKSSKTNDVLPRSHNGRAAWGCLPLCKECHLEQHRVGEREFETVHELNYGIIVATLLVAHYVEGEV